MLPMLNEFKEKLLRDSRSPFTIKGIVWSIIHLSKYLKDDDMRKVSSKDVERYKTYLITEHIKKDGKNLSNATIRHRLQDLKPYFRFLLDNKHIFFDPMLNLIVPKKVIKLPSYIPSEKDIEEFISQPDTYTYLGIRDKLLFELAYTCPLRRKELKDLSLQDIDMKDKYIYPKRAKNGYECGIPIMDSTYKTLEKYLKISRPRLLRKAKADTDSLFLTDDGSPFKAGTVDRVFLKYRGTKKIHPHLMRHACAVHMLKNGARIRDIQVLLGHRRLTTTQIYTALTADDLKDMHERFHPREKQFKDLNSKPA